jgi:hypothetical protein
MRPFYPSLLRPGIRNVISLNRFWQSLPGGAVIIIISIPTYNQQEQYQEVKALIINGIYIRSRHPVSVCETLTVRMRTIFYGAAIPNIAKKVNFYKDKVRMIKVQNDNL